MKKKTVWIVNEYNFPDDENTRQTNLCKQLNSMGYDAYIISGSTENKGEKNRISGKEKYSFVSTEEAKGFMIKTSDYRNSYQRVLVSLQYQHRLWRLRKDLPNPDVIISDFAGLFGIVFLKWKKKYGIKLIYDILDLWPEAFVAMGYMKREAILTKVLYLLEHKTYKAADGIIFSFQGGKDYINSKGWGTDVGGDIDTGRIGYLNNGVNLDVLDKQKTSFIFSDTDLESDQYKAIYLGSVSDFNGLDVLVEAARVLKKREIDDIVILIYGYGNKEEELKSLAEKYELDNIKFKGKTDRKYAMSLLSRGDVTIFTFKDTGVLQYGVSPNKLFMYFASGKPVLSMVKPNYDLVEEKHAGISVDNDPEKVADALVRFSKLSEEKYNEYCTNARKTAEEYDYKELVKVLVDLIEGDNAI